MNTETDNPTEESEATSGVDPQQDAEEVQAEAGDEAQIESAEFQDFESTPSKTPAADLARIQKIQISVSAELGRATIPIQDLMNLAEGSVVELNRDIDSPVELYAQGVPLAAGEVIVVDGHFAIRIINVYENK